MKIQLNYYMKKGIIENAQWCMNIDTENNLEILKARAENYINVEIAKDDELTDVFCNELDAIGIALLVKELDLKKQDVEVSSVDKAMVKLVYAVKELFEEVEGE